jgi:hypothetical protein
MIFDNFTSYIKLYLSFISSLKRAPLLQKCHDKVHPQPILQNLKEINRYSNSAKWGMNATVIFNFKKYEHLF